MTKEKKDRKAYQKEYYQANREKFRERYLETREEKLQKAKERNALKPKKERKPKYTFNALEILELVETLRTDSDLSEEKIAEIIENIRS